MKRKLWPSGSTTPKHGWKRLSALPVWDGGNGTFKTIGSRGRTRCTKSWEFRQPNSAARWKHFGRGASRRPLRDASALGATLKRDEQFVHEFRTLDKDGTVRHLRSQAKLSRDGFGWPVRLYGTSQDVTARTLAVLGLVQSEQKYRDLVETSNELIWSVDLQGRLTFVNQAVREIYGYEPEELLGQVFAVLLPPERRETDWKVFESVLGGQRLFDYETVHLRKDGRRIDLTFNAIVMRCRRAIHRRDRHGDRHLRTQAATRSVARTGKLVPRDLRERAQCLLILSPDGKLLDINPTGRELFEATASDQLLGHSVSDWLVPQSQFAFNKTVEAVRRSGSVVAGTDSE